MSTMEAPYAGSVMMARESEPRKEIPKSTRSPAGRLMIGVLEMDPSRLIGYAYMKPGSFPFPLITAMRAVDEGLKTRSETVPGGPTGGVVWLSGIERSPPSGVRPIA